VAHIKIQSNKQSFKEIIPILGQSELQSRHH